MTNKLKLQSLSGMNDILPNQQVYLKRIQKSVENTTKYYSFQSIDVPVVEYAEVFSKGAGALSDIVEKEMYTFKTKGGDLVALRPESPPLVLKVYISFSTISDK